MNKKITKISVIFIFFLIFAGFTSIFIPGTTNLSQTDNNSEFKNQTPSIAGYTLLWNYTTGDEVHSVDISDDGYYITAGSSDNKTYLFNKTSAVLKTPMWDYETGDKVNDVAISGNGKYVTAGSDDYRTYLFNTTDTADPHLWDVGIVSDVVFRVAISYNGQYIASATFDFAHPLNLFDNTGSWLQNYPVTCAYPLDVAISSDGNYITCGGIAGGNGVYLFEKSANPPIWELNFMIANSLSISSYGDYIAVGGYSGMGQLGVSLFNNTSASPKTSIWTNESIYVLSIAISSDGNYIVAGSNDDNVYLFHNSGPMPLWHYQTNDDVNSVAISSDGSYIAAGSSDNKVYLFHKSSSTPKWNHKTDDEVQSVAISSDGKYVAAGGLDNQTYLFYNELPPAPAVGGGDDDDDDDKKGEAIPGYELLLLIGFICVTSAILIRKLNK